MTADQLRKQFNLGSDLQAMFCLEYLIDLNATKAAIRAGYSAKNPSRSGADALRIPKVQEAIAYLKDERSKNILVDEEYVIKVLKTIVNRCLQVTPVLNRNGDPIGEYRFNPTEARKSAELLGEHLKMWKRTPQNGHLSQNTLLQINFGTEDLNEIRNVEQAIDNELETINYKRIIHSEGSDTEEESKT
tara:strand:- start:14 stop:580 length:567 start_codon:yes stop_codon:yes gene_type:complete